MMGQQHTRDSLCRPWLAPRAEAAEDPDVGAATGTAPGASSSGSDAGSPAPRAGAVSPVQPRTHLQKGVIQHVNYKTKFGLACSSTGEPSSVEEALYDPHWRKAMEEEYSALKKNKTWHLVPLVEKRALIQAGLAH